MMKIEPPKMTTNQNINNQNTFPKKNSYQFDLQSYNSLSRETKVIGSFIFTMVFAIISLLSRNHEIQGSGVFILIAFEFMAILSFIFTVSQIALWIMEAPAPQDK